jgi:iron complex outermembrane receptor protein
LAAWVALLGPVADAVAQHAADNPVVSAADAFGLTLGTESTGIYNPQSVRGFNPQVAGNVRIDGLYFDQQGGLSNRVVEGSTIRVGVSEIGYAFPAPTGIVDYDLRHATNGVPAATIIAQAGPFDNRSISVDGNLPLISKQLQLPLGVSYQAGAPIPSGPNLGYTSTVVNVGAAPQWTPSDRLTVRGFVDWQDMSDARTLPIVFSRGNFLPPRIRREFLGQDWAEARYLSKNTGVTVDAKLSRYWSLAAGVFRSVSDTTSSYADLYLNTDPAGLADHVLVGFPDQVVASTSGEARLTGHFEDGRWFHDIVFLLRGRDAVAHYGGSGAVDAGTALIGEGAQVRRPDFAYTARTDDRTKLWSTGMAYQGRISGLGELALGAQKEFYEKAVVAAGDIASRLTDRPWRFYGTAAVPMPGRVIFYADYTQGFEDSGVAPSSAVNAGAILPTTRTWQVDGGLRYPLTPKLNLVAGLFEVNKPYFNFDTGNVDRKLGVQRASGLELSVAGELTTHLNVNAGAVIGQVRVTGPNLAAEGVGSAAIGQPHAQYLINLNYELPKWPAFSIDLGVYHFGAVPASVNDAFYVPAVTVLNIGDRYKFNIMGAPATLRMQIQNLTNSYIWNIGLSPGFFQFAPRSFVTYLTVDV